MPPGSKRSQPMPSEGNASASRSDHQANALCEPRLAAHMVKATGSMRQSWLPCSRNAQSMLI